MGLFDMFRHKTNKVVPEEKTKPKKNDILTHRSDDYSEKKTENEQNCAVDFKENDPEKNIVPVEKQIPTLKANKEGLFPHEILAMEYASKYFVGGEFAGFWWYRYGVKDMNTLMDSLIERGYIRIGSIIEGLQTYKVEELKKELGNNNLKISGKKAELIQRLIENMPEKEISDRFPRRPYVITDEGKEAIKYDGYVLYAHRHGYEGIDIFSLNRMIDGHTKLYRDYIWRHLNQVSLEYAMDENYAGYRYVRYQMAQFVMEEGKYENAMMLLTEFCFWATSGMDTKYFNIETAGKYWFPYENSFIRVPVGIVKTLCDCRSAINMDDDELEKKLYQYVNRLSSPFHVFTKEEVVRIIQLELKKDSMSLEALYNGAKERLQKKYPGVSFEG